MGDRMHIIITIDGPSGAGKGTVAKYLADKFHLKKLDTGLLYRVLAKRMVERNIDLTDMDQIISLARGVALEDVNLEGLRTEEVASMASKIAVIPAVREVLAQLQRDFAYANPAPHIGVILDGRDIGTVICPDASCKIYLTARDEIRVERRHQQLKISPSDKIRSLMKERDNRDQLRATAPLAAAEDAYIIDTSDLTIDQVCSMAANYILCNCLANQVMKK
jgi:CMP/dCMP kinase